MKIKQIYPGTKSFREVKKLYLEAFPQEERLPFFRMVLLSMLKPSVKLLSYYDGNRFSGFTFTVEMDSFLYINYIAVCPNMRSHGCGKSMVDLLNQRHPKPQLCEVKLPTEGDPEYPKDLRRMEFWKRNGFDFYDNQHIIQNPHGISYVICGKGIEFDRESYFAIFDRLSFGPKALLRSMGSH